MKKIPSKKLSPIRRLVEVMATLRGPGGCPWDQEQDHQTLRWHAVEEVYELLDAIEADDDGEMTEELGDLLLQVVFHAQLGSERKAFDFDAICHRLVEKLIRRHPHVFGNTQVRDVNQVWANWERIKRAEKAGSTHERKSALDGIPKHLPALLRTQKLVRKARKAGLCPSAPNQAVQSGVGKKPTRSSMAQNLFELVAQAESLGWSAEDLLRTEANRRERSWRTTERKILPSPAGGSQPSRRR